MRKDIYTISATCITNEGLIYEDEVTVVDFHYEGTAIKEAANLAKGLAANFPQEVFNVTVFAGETQENGNISGDPFDIFTVSSKGVEETAKARKEAGYVAEYVDAYIINGRMRNYKAIKKNSK